MSAKSIGVLHPGAMGVSVAATARNSGCDVYWVSEGRRSYTRERAAAAGLIDAGTLAALCQRCPVITSVCPPAFAEQLLEEVIGAGFSGTFVDANALMPTRKQRMAERAAAAGIRFVDGGIIGLPQPDPAPTWLYLSGPAAGEIPPYFSGGPIFTEVLGPDVGRASALKICFAGHNKGMIALYAAMLATARHYGVFEDLKRQWSRRGPSFSAVEEQILRAAPKAWRWEPEMHEIAATLERAGMPAGFHQAAAEVYARLRECKDTTGTLEEVLRKLA